MGNDAILVLPDDAALCMPGCLDNPAAWNMAVDEALLACTGTCMPGVTVRLYRWNRPALTIGRFQSLNAAIDMQICRTEALPLARRITGGRAILHGTDVTVCIVGQLGDIGLVSSASIRQTYAHLGSLFVDAYQEVGAPARMGSPVRGRSGARVGDCFQLTTEADVVSSGSGHKALGAALHLRDQKFLLQASMRTSECVDQIGLAAALFGSSGAITAAELLEPCRLIQAVANVVSAHYTVRTATPEALAAVRGAAAELYARRYADEHWTSVR